ncbi:DUF2939 domain-containing protein [Phenylobacterium sp.]|uniref:DUF2939 domain-containing protein n=1 Tax=Phenylobacterium sp. TaxID=1871053 RepID=UPI002737540B|nr:DUF2939 domain-containing protein [Phenylobacterium sp.]MDP3852754.1 DUF2939 domain-containing protein [Phenylobacterium sp.]
MAHPSLSETQPVRHALLVLTALLLSSCATTQRFDAANDVHALLVSIRDDDRTAFEAHVDRPALKRQVESRLLAETRKANAGDGATALSILLSPLVADLAGDLLVQPRVFRAAADYYGYGPDTSIPNALVIGGQLKAMGDGRVCATRRKDGPCLLVFTETAGTWRLSGFEGDLSMLRTKH